MLARSATASTILGYISISAWLGAQFPQLIENARRQSVDGLALPFLANWFFGDATNLIGCILTDQLPFQTVVAIYFCFVDLCLLGQYVYYTRPHFAQHDLESPPLTPPDESPNITPTGSSATITNASRRRQRSISEISEISDLPQARGAELVQLDSPTSYYNPRSLSRSTILREHSEQDRPPSGSRMTSPVSPTSPTENRFSLAREHSMDYGRAEGGPSMASMAKTASTQRRQRNVSWDSESTALQGQGRAISRGNNPGSVPRLRQPLPRTSVEAFWNDMLSSRLQAEADLERGRTRRRGQYDLVSHVSPVPETSLLPVAAAGTEGQLLETDPLGHYPTVLRQSRSPEASVRRKSKNRASAPVVLFSVWLLFSFGGSSTLGTRRIQRPRSPPGIVLRRPPTIYSTSQYFPTPSSLSSSFSTSLPSPEPPTFILPELKLNHSDTHEQFGDSEINVPDTRLVIGRASAWTCTTLYLTSRLPQIWKNYTRQSVEGLTMSLFVCAFLGNFFYVASIMMNPTLDEPPPMSSAFLKESIPYILGSGGTLLFDVTIVMQSFLYRGRKPLDPLSVSGYLPPRSVGMGGSLSASTITSRASTMRNGQLRRTLGGRPVSTSPMGSINPGRSNTLPRHNLGHMYGGMPEREPLLAESVKIEDRLGTPPMPRYRSTSIS